LDYGYSNTVWESSKAILETILLLKALNEVQGVPSAHGLDSNECPCTQRADLLKRKFLDFFVFVCATRKGGANVSAACMEENQSGETIIRFACNTGVRDSVLSDAQAIIQILTQMANGGKLATITCKFHRNN